MAKGLLRVWSVLADLDDFTWRAGTYCAVWFVVRGKEKRDSQLFSALCSSPEEVEEAGRIMTARTTIPDHQVNVKSDGRVSRFVSG